MAKVVTNKKCKDQLMLHLPVAEDKFMVIEDNQTLSLGNKTLKFMFVPWVHWPETMMTYVEEDKVLFTADFLGSHLTSTDLFVTDEADVLREAKLYYADILMPFRANIKNHLAKIDTLDVKYIAPSHGQVYDKPALILDAYKDWVSDNVRNLVVIPYTTTHGNVQKMVDRLVKALSDRGVAAKPYHVTRTDIGALSMDLVDAATVVLGTSTYIMGPHPHMAFHRVSGEYHPPQDEVLVVLRTYAWANEDHGRVRGDDHDDQARAYQPVFSQGAPAKKITKISTGWRTP
jgi:flavorubredoxin